MIILDTLYKQGDIRWNITTNRLYGHMVTIRPFGASGVARPYGTGVYFVRSAHLYTRRTTSMKLYLGTLEYISILFLVH